MRLKATNFDPSLQVVDIKRVTTNTGSCTHAYLQRWTGRKPTLAFNFRQNGHRRFLLSDTALSQGVFPRSHFLTAASAVTEFPSS
jgi:hypothetical protein